MPQWTDDLSLLSLDEILKSHAENREWSKELRRRTNVLVNSRLANDISQAEYQADRKQTHEETAECRRRAHILDDQINRHQVHATGRVR
jgi:hypothetical protein